MLNAGEEHPAPGPPIYHQIARVLRSRIFHGLYPAGTSIPSENELAREFSVARLTVRQAIQELRREGALVSRRGSGTFVPLGLRMVRPVHFLGYLEDLILQSLTLVTRVGPIRSVPAPSPVRKAYGLGADAKVVRIERTRYANGEPVQYSINYLLPKIARELSLEKLGDGSLSEMLAQEGGIETTSASQTLTAAAATAETARALETKVGAPLLTSEIVGFSGVRAVNFSHVFYRPDHVFFTATLTSVAGDPRLNRTAVLPRRRQARRRNLS
ncbi:MAG: GntR family transcriptional regulator [Thermoleophilaceae bacterium]